MRTISGRSLSPLLFMVLVSFNALDARAAGFVKLCEIPSSVADPVRTELENQKAELTVERSSIKRIAEVSFTGYRTSEGEWIPAECKGLKAGSSKDIQCMATHQVLSTRQKSHNQDVKAFCDKVTAHASMARRFKRGKWIPGTSVSNVLGLCTTTWSCQPSSPIMRSSDSRRVSTGNRVTRGACQVTNDPESCGRCLSKEPSVLCEYCVEPKECSNPNLGWRTREALGCCE